MDPSQTKILITDDDPSIRESFTDYLEDRDYQVLTADNGIAGLAQFNQHAPDLVLMDLRMPEMDGIDMIKNIRAFDSETPLIVISGTSHIGDAIAALVEGAWDFLLKPVSDLNVLIHTVEKALQHARLIRENRMYQENLEQLVTERTNELRLSNQKLESINLRLRKIVDTTSTLSLCKDLHQFGKQLLNEFAKHMVSSGGSLYLVEDDGLHLLHVLDPGHAPQHLPFPLGEGSVMQRAMQQKKPILLKNQQDLQELTRSGWSGYLNGSVMVFPILDENEAVSAIVTLHNKSDPPFLEQDRDIGTILASYSCESLRAIRHLEELTDSERRFRELADMLPQSVFETDVDGKLSYANQMALDSFGYNSFEEMTGQSILDIVSEKDRYRAESQIKSCLSEDEHHVYGHEFMIIRRDHSEFPALVYIDAIKERNKVTGIRSAVVDISLLKEQEAKILHQAHFDHLTDLPNRFLALDRLEQMINDAKRNRENVAVLFLDLDDFKKINDTLGHETGDQLLIQAADRLNSLLRRGDTVGRLGGDEFLILLGGLSNITPAQTIAENILENFRNSFNHRGRELVVTASIGISVYPDDGDSPSDLLRTADAAMYHSKELGRNTYCFFTAAMNKEVSRRLALEEQIHGALEREEFYLCYQPKVDLKTGNIMGAEALLRWDNTKLGSVSPEEFIPIAEQTGLIVDIGRFVMLEAFSQAVNWDQSCGDFQIAVNLSPVQFRDPGLLDFVKSAIDKTGINSSNLELEITEGVLLSGSQHIETVLYELSGLGLKISLDDFGTGYSSLNYLRQYPFDVLKIDRSFINDISSTTDDYKLVNAAIAMAHGLSLQVVAEGVETEIQYNYLREHQCDYAQGYLLSKPIRAGEIKQLLEQKTSF